MTLGRYYNTYLDHVEEQYVKLHTYEAMIDKEVFELYEKGKAIEDISIELGINPVSVASMRKELPKVPLYW